MTNQLIIKLNFKICTFRPLNVFFVLTFPNRYRLDELCESKGMGFRMNHDHTHTHVHMESCHGIFKKICTIFINCWMKVEVFLSMVYFNEIKKPTEKEYFSQ